MTVTCERCRRTREWRDTSYWWEAVRPLYDEDAARWVWVCRNATWCDDPVPRRPSHAAPAPNDIGATSS